MMELNHDNHIPETAASHCTTHNREMPTEENVDNSQNVFSNSSALPQEKKSLFSPFKSKYMIIPAIALIIICALVFHLSTPCSKFIKQIKKGDFENAQITYADASAKERKKMNDELANYCENLISQYNHNKISYNDAEEQIASSCDIIEDQSWKDSLIELNTSKTSYNEGLEHTSKEEWDEAKKSYEQVIESDANYQSAQDNMLQCDKKLSTIAFENAKSYEKENNWCEALTEYSKVSEITPEQYEEAQKHINICTENLKNTIGAQLKELLDAQNYDEGIRIINTAEKYISEDKTLQEYKTIFSDKKAEADRLKEAAKYDTGITYNQLARNPDNYNGSYVKFYGKVLQVQTSDNITVYRIGTAGYFYSDDVIYAIQYSDNASNRILEDDYVTVKGISSGLYTYKTVMGNSITIPSIFVDHIEH